MKLIATYARVSTANQEKQETIKNQIDAFKVYAEQNDCKIVREYADDGWSGSILARPGLDQMRNDARSKIFDTILFYDPDRLSRVYLHQALVMDELAKINIEIIFITTATPKNEEEKLMYGVRGLFVQYEKMKIADRFRLGKVRTVKEGKIVTSQASYGHKYIPNVKLPDQPMVHGHYDINPQEAEVIKNIFNWIDIEGLTLRKVVTRLHELGIKPRKSKRGVWNTSTLSTLIRNKALIGEAHWGKSYGCVPEHPKKLEKYKKNEKSSRRDKPEKEWIANKIPVPRIIDPEQFERVQARLKVNFALCQRNKKNEYLLGGRIHCVCGNRRAGEGPMQGKHLYYRCNDRVLSYPLPKKCKEKGINARIADNLTWEKFKEFATSPELMLEQASRWIVKLPKGAEAPIEDIKPLKEEIKKLKKQEDRINKAYAAGAFTIGQLTEYNEPIKNRIAELETRIMNAEQGVVSAKTFVMPSQNQVMMVAQFMAEKLKNLNFEQKRAIIISVLAKVIGSQKQLQVAGYLPLTENFYKYVEYKTECGDRRVTQCRQVHSIPSNNQ